MGTASEPRIWCLLMTRDARIKLHVRNGQAGNRGGRRSVIEGFSPGSQRRILELARNVQGMKGFGTVTYPADYPNSGPVVKRHIGNLCKRLRRRGVSGFWFLEFQARGAPHFHLVFDKWVSKGDLAEWWHEIIGSPDEAEGVGTRVEAIRNREAGVGAYVAKYVGKCEQKFVPPGFEGVGRFWAVFGEVDRGLRGGASSPRGGSVEMVSRVLRRSRRIRRGGRQGRAYRGAGPSAKLLVTYFSAEDEERRLLLHNAKGTRYGGCHLFPPRG